MHNLSVYNQLLQFNFIHGLGPDVAHTCNQYTISFHSMIKATTSFSPTYCRIGLDSFLLYHCILLVVLVSSHSAANESPLIGLVAASLTSLTTEKRHNSVWIKLWMEHVISILMLLILRTRSVNCDSGKRYGLNAVTYLAHTNEHLHILGSFILGMLWKSNDN